MSRITEIADAVVAKTAELHPIAATAIGIPGYDHLLTDFSPEGASERAAAARSALSDLEDVQVDSDRDRIARDAMVEDLTTSVDAYDRDDHLRALNVIASPFQSLRQAFDLMPKESEEQWTNIAARMAAVSDGAEKFKSALEAGRLSGKAVSQRQVRECAAQAAVWSGEKAGSQSFFHGLAAEFDSMGLTNEAIKSDLASAADSAAEAYISLKTYLTDTYMADAPEADAVGIERYMLGARRFLGMEVDVDDAYDWAWEELTRLDSQIAITSDKILPGADLGQISEFLASDPKNSIEGEDAFRDHMQKLQEETIAAMDGVHFDIPEPVKKIEVMIAPKGGALAPYYTSPSDDFSRPGRIWYPMDGKSVFPLWTEISIAYHEGTPGHHFQLGTTTFLRDQLTSYQRFLAGTSGHVEGWGLYAERLMKELGYLEDPAPYLGLLVSQSFRTARVIIDIGMHMEKKIPAGQSSHPGETWNAELGLEFLLPRCPYEEAFARSEIDRYLGWPGQAISYKLGEREWLNAREAARTAQGEEWNLKAWHTRALELGPMGLAQMTREMTRDNTRENRG